MPTAKKTILPKNKYKCGMVAIVGRPNVGKSTLLNTILGEKIAIVTTTPQTTRNQIRGIYNDQRGQIIFIDTPGIHLAKDQLDKYMNNLSKSTITDADCVIHLADPNRVVGPEEEFVVQQLKQLKTPIILGLNKLDLKGPYMQEYIQLWERAKDKPISEIEEITMIALSAKNEKNIDKLLEIVFDKLPAGPALYPLDTVTDFPQKLAIADIIREKLFNLMREEIPHSLGVVIEQMQPKKKKTIHITAIILVERESQKEIVIGKRGNILKQVGSEARKELEALLDSKVFLELYVKTQERWRDDTSMLQELGYSI